MLAVKSQGKIVQKVLRTKAGQSVLATFFVIEREGEFDVRLLSVSPIQKPDGIRNYARPYRAYSGTFGRELGIRNEPLCLTGRCQKSPAVISYRKNHYSVVSPFFNIFEFLVSQPTRAPSH